MKQFPGFYSNIQIFEEASHAYTHKNGPCSIVYHSKIWNPPKCPLIGNSYTRYGRTTRWTNNNSTVKKNEPDLYALM